MNALYHGLSQLAREGDTRALELVVGLLLLTLGLQHAGASLGLWAISPSLAHVLPVLVGMLSVAMIISGALKVVGSILSDTSLRIVASGLGAISWLYLSLLMLLVASPLVTMLWVILFAQSAWVYTRLSILQQQRRRHEL